VKLVEKDGQKYAMKIFEPKELNQWETLVAQIKKEYELVCNLNCEGIIKYYDFADNVIWKTSRG